MDFTLITNLYSLIESKQALLVNSSIYGVLSLIGPILTLLLTVRFMLSGLYTLYNPGVGEPLSFLIKDYIRVVIILSLATSLAWYQQSLLPFVFSLPDTLTSVMFRFDNNSSSNLVELLQQDVNHCLNFIAQALAKSKKVASSLALQNQTAGIVMIISCTLYAGVSGGLLIVAKLMLGLTLCFSPLAIICLIWETSRALFFSWLATLIRFELLTLLLLMVMGLFMALYHQLVMNLAPGRDVLIVALSTLILSFINVFVFYQVYQLAQSLSAGLNQLPGVSQLMTALAGAGNSPVSIPSIGSFSSSRSDSIPPANSAQSSQGLSGRARGSRGK